MGANKHIAGGSGLGSSRAKCVFVCVCVCTHACTLAYVHMGSKNVVKVGRRRGRQQEHTRLNKQYCNAISDKVKIIHFD